MTKNIAAKSWQWASGATSTGGTYNSDDLTPTPPTPPTPGAYVGIPDITGTVPSAIMPVLPQDAAFIDAFPYDPTDIATPTFANASNQYYIDSVNGNDGTAGNSGRGSVALPRETLPGLVPGTIDIWTLPVADCQIFMTSNSTFFDASDDVHVLVGRTNTAQSWLIGVGGQPKFRMDKFFFDGEHVILDNIHIHTITGKSRIKFGNDGFSLYFKYGTIRNSTLQGTGLVSTGTMLGGDGTALNPSQFICIFNNHIFDIGDSDAIPSADDHHGIQPTGYAHHWWILDNHIHHCQGDAIQVATSNFTNFNFALRPHYIYIAGNEMHDNREQDLDCKNCYHVIFSSNECYNNTTDQGSTILINDGEGPLASYQWAINNIIHDVDTGLKVASNQAEDIDDPAAEPPLQTVGCQSFIIGNLVYNCTNTGILLDARGTTESFLNNFRSWYGRIDILFNTLVTDDRAALWNRVNGGSASEVSTVNMYGNISHNGTPPNTYDWEFDQGNGQINNFEYNLLYRVGGTVDVRETKLTTAYPGNNIENSDPLFTNAGANDYTLQAGSPAREVTGFSTEPTAIELFNTMYGLDINIDINGNTRPVLSLFDAGAYED